MNAVVAKTVFEALADITESLAGTSDEQVWRFWLREARRRLVMDLNRLQPMPGYDHLSAKLTDSTSSVSWDFLVQAFLRGDRRSVLRGFGQFDQVYPTRKEDPDPYRKED